MRNKKIMMEVLNSVESIAIVRYFEGARYISDCSWSRYVMLRINQRTRNIQELEIPDSLIPVVGSKLNEFDEVLRNGEGVVWERGSFRERVRASVTRREIEKFIEG